MGQQDRNKADIIAAFRAAGIDAVGVAPYEQDGFCSCIVVLFPYYAGEGEPDAQIAKYARGLDYHQAIKNRLTAVGQEISRRISDFSYEIHVDVSPHDERALALAAGLGFRGKNGLLIHEKYGSYVFIATMRTNLCLPPDKPLEKTCMGCMRCVRACPGGALSDGFAPERCLSAISQQKKISSRQEELLKKGKYAWGCDVCQDVCPHNQNLPKTSFWEFSENLMQRFDGVSADGFRKKYADRAFSWRGFNVISRNLRIIYEKNENPTK
jgi:epoxyqueuosine reductase